jgi:hypothetical protein
MPDGSITDPRLNQDEKDYGILVDLSSGHNYYYLKDKDCQYLTHGIPVTFDLMIQQVNINGNLLDIDFARNVMVDPAKIGSHPVYSQLNSVSPEAVKGNTGHNRPEKKYKL